MSDKVWRFLASRWLSAILLVLLVGSLCFTVSLRRATHADGGGVLEGPGQQQAVGLVQALEQYWVDHPSTTRPVNNAEWVKRLAGQEPSGIRYLKTDKFLMSKDGRLLDSCHQPWAILFPGDGAFQRNDGANKSPDEINARGCDGLQNGDLSYPRFKRS